MTSPDKSVPTGAYVGTAGASNNISNLQKLTWEGARESTVSGVIGSFAGVTAIGGNWKAITDKSQSATTTAQTRSSEANSTAASAQTVADVNKATIEALTPRRPGEQLSGTTFSDDFERTELGSGYTTYKFGQVPDLTIVSGQVQLNQGGDKPIGYGSVVVALSKTVLRTDDQSVSAVMGRANQAGASNTPLYIRAAPDLATFVYVDILANEVRLGRGTRTTGLNYTPWGTAAVTLRTGDTVTLNAVGANYQVLINGVPILAYNDSVESSPVGVGNRSFGFGNWYTWLASFAYSSFSFAVAALTASDLVSPPVTGIGWALARISSANVPQPAGSRAVAAGTFDTVRHSSAVTVSALGLGQVQVPVSGWYRMSLGLYFTVPTVIGADLWWAPNSAATWRQLRTGPKILQLQDYGYASSVEATFVVFLPAGAVVAPGCSSLANNNLFGPNTYFDGALINRA
ncbi:hypothetical protein ERC79_17055 [Rhodococcus sp. ABRD24]|uniref:DUF7257 domain-containing protein n=1 Tax=Rhodococcus sp. ABRD24 TaxID=2507582 RepID=UPI00103E3139|nr:hypothetical protein [Rhodococcus sp. ABRD24]QBJ97457.1 hypothetical protein ERC79_17055 [Rhodococcus sp. ABRD24]